DHQDVAFLRDRDVLNGTGERIGIAAARKKPCDDFAAGQRSEGKRLNELLGRPGHHDLYLVAELTKCSHKLHALVSRDAAANTKYYTHRTEVYSAASSSRCCSSRFRS